MLSVSMQNDHKLTAIKSSKMRASVVITVLIFARRGQSDCLFCQPALHHL
jgi:hypothetical protein